MFNLYNNNASWDFDVQKQDVFYQAPSGDMVSMPDRKAIVRTDTGKHLAIMSDKYAIVPNSVVVENARAAFSSMGLDVKEKFRTLNGGARFRAEFTIPSIKVDVGKRSVGDFVELKAIAGNSYDGGAFLSWFLEGHRLACLNGMTVGTNLFKARQKHIGRVDVGRTVRQLQEAIAAFEGKVAPYWRELAEIDVPVVRIEEELDNSIKPGGMTRKFADAALSQLERETTHRETATLWNLFNAFTHVTTHVVRPNKLERSIQLEGIADKFMRGMHRQYALAA